MLNPITAYAECGKRAAIARNEGDEARYTHEKRWCTSALGLEKSGDREFALIAYNMAYSEHRAVPPIDYFR